MNEREDVLDSLLFYIHDADHTGPFDQPLYPEGWVDVGVIDCKRAAAEIKRLRAAQPEVTEAQVERADIDKFGDAAAPANVALWLLVWLLT